MKNKVKAFTLIELIVVIAIIGILAAILVPSLAAYMRSAKMAQYNANARQVYEASQLMLHAQAQEDTDSYVIIGDSSSIATCSNGDSVDLSKALGDTFDGYFGIYISTTAQTMYAVWSPNEITEDLVKSYTAEELEDIFSSAKLGAYPIK